MDDSEAILLGPHRLTSGLQLRATPGLCALLQEAIPLPGLTDDEKTLLRSHAEYVPEKNVPYELMKFACLEVRQQKSREGKDGPWLHQAASRSDLFLPSPKPRQKSQELRARLARLQEAADRREYAELVKDITAGERHLANREAFSTYKEQLSFGLHVIAVMFTGFMVGYATLRAQFPHQPTLHAAGGLLGLIGGMLLEVTLFIIRGIRAEESQERTANQRRLPKLRKDTVTSGRPILPAGSHYAATTSESRRHEKQ